MASTVKSEFIVAMQRDTPGTDLPRYVAIIDKLFAWSERRPELVLRDAGARPGVVRFDRAKAKDAFWSAQVVRANAPKLEIHLAASRASSAADRARVMETLNAHSREVLLEGDRLRIGFGALKNPAALTAVIALMESLLAEAPAPAVERSTESSAT